MRLDLHAGTGALRLDEAGFDALVAATAPGGSPPAPVPAAVPAVAAVLADGRWRTALEVVHAATARLTLTVAGPDARLVHRGWVRPDGCVLLLAVHGDERQLVLHHPAFLAAGLVRLTRIRPRRLEHERSPVPLDAWTRDHLTTADPAIRQAALGAAGAGFAWRLELRAGDREQVLTAVDGSGGIHVHDPDAGVLLPTTNTAVFRVLSALVPVLAGR